MCSSDLLTGDEIAGGSFMPNGLWLMFACFGAGTPDQDQFLMDLSQAGSQPALAPKPFMILQSG